MSFSISVIVTKPFDLSRRPMVAGDRFWATPIEAATLLAFGKVRADPKPPAKPVEAKEQRPPKLAPPAPPRAPNGRSRAELRAEAQRRADRAQAKAAADAAKRAPFMAMLEGPDALDAARELAKAAQPGTDPVLMAKITAVLSAADAPMLGGVA